ncbi:MAG TPA: RnfH family protein [Casimicrobiaceae bacterium]|nr:RnfH family protein [Casimicrobiaceae bacterium]
MRVEVAYVGAGFEARVAVVLDEGACVADAVERSGLLARIPEPAGDLACAIFGRRADAGSPLADGDRVELTRPLVRDPRLARRRAAEHRRRLR